MSKESPSRQQNDKTRIMLNSPSGQLGGMELRIADEARFLLDIGYDPFVAINVFPQIEGLVADLRNNGVPVHDYDPPPFLDEWRWRRFNKIRALLFSTKFIRTMKPALAHIFMPWTNQGLTRLWLCSHCNVDSIISVRNAFPPNEFSDWHSEHLREAFRTVRGVYAVSKSAFEHFQGVFGEFMPPGVKLEVIHNFVDTDRFRPSDARRAEARKMLGVPDGALVIGSVGRLDDQKRPWELLSLYAQLRREISPLYLVLVGQGPLEQDMKAKAREMGIENGVIFAGFRQDVDRIIPALDVHLLLSRNEGFGTITVEAMACGVPVIGTDVPGTSDILTDSKAGILVPLDDERSIVQATSSLLRNEELRKAMASEGRNEAKAKFDICVWKKAIRNFYESVLETES